jgi:hypothetical protein
MEQYFLYILIKCTVGKWIQVCGKGDRWEINYLYLYLYLMVGGNDAIRQAPRL